MPGKVNVLLSAYNGEKFLREQLDSILAQFYDNMVIHVRDDGSTDNTVVLLKDYALKYPNFKVAPGQNIGVVNSFFTLLKDADPLAEYFAFADQDDFWLSEKITNAVNSLRANSADQPLLYCSRVEYVDSNLNHLGFSRLPGRIGFGNALVENIVPGCTVVMNRQARAIILEHLPNNTVMHDWWFYLVISAFGRIIFDLRPTIKYRQHENNVMGAATGRMGQFIRRLGRLFQDGPHVFEAFDQAREFRRCFGGLLPREKRVILDKFLAFKGHFWTRINYALKMDVWRQTWVDNLLLRILIIFGWY